MAKREHTFESIEHTADVGAVGRGKTKAEAFENLAFGMFKVMADIERYSPESTTRVEVEGDDDLDLLQRFLSSLIALMDSESVLPLDFTVIDMQPGSLTCEVAIRPMGDDIEWLGPQVKAVTYHEMAVKEQDGEWLAQAIFDV